MNNDLIRFEDENFEAGLDAYSRDFTREPLLSFSSYNVSMHRVQGVGPRYGFTPLYTHSQYFERVYSGTSYLEEYGGERQLTDATTTVSTTTKCNSLGLVPIKIGSVVYYFHIFTKQRPTSTFWIDCSTGISSITSATLREAGAGLDKIIYLQSIPDRSAYARVHNNLLSTEAAIYSNTAIKKCRESTTNVTNADIAVYTFSGQVYPVKYLIGECQDNNIAHANFSAFSDTVSFDGYNVSYGPVSDMINLSYPNGPRKIVVNAMVLGVSSDKFTLKNRYEYTETVTSTASIPTFSARNLATDMNLTSTPTVTSGRIDGSLSYISATIRFSFIECNFLKQNSAYKAIFAAAKRPTCYLIQDTMNLRAYAGLGRNMAQYIDLTSHALFPKDLITTDFYSAAAYYQEHGVSKTTCFYNWPSFTGTALSDNAVTSRSGGTQITLGAANSGLLRANRNYELTYAYFDRSTSTETNVGTPVKFRSGANDYVALSLFRQINGPASPIQNCYLGAQGSLPTPVSYTPYDGTLLINGGMLALNQLEIRFYYREVGQQTWFPSLFMEAANFFGNPNHDIIWACAAPIGGLPGGEPGGFNDYSPLPNDEYTEVKVFQERVFWLSANNLVFSRKRNPFAYSIYNNVSIPESKFNGMIIHQFDGESYQTSRLCIFGSQQYYAGVVKGAGYGVEVPVALSDGTTAAYELDGSDFEVSFRHNATAFSGRAAVVADGILYFWGPKGIYRDNGVQTPQKISKALEPDILTLYAHQYVDRIHCIYNESSREIIWFYVKNEATVNANTTWALAYHIDKGAFYNLSFAFVVDWARDLQREDSSADAATNQLGDKRTLVAIRQTAADTNSTLFYFDSLNKTGDMYPGKDLHLYKCASQGNDIYRLYLPGSYGAAAIVGIAANDKLAICQSLSYQGSGSPLGTTSIDGIYVINGTGLDGVEGKYYIDVVSRTTVLPNFTAATVTTSGISITPNMIPMYHQGNNGISYNLVSRMWAPAGLKSWFLWLKGHLLFKVDLLSSASAQTTTFSYASNLSANFLANTVTLTDNQGSTGYSQRVLALKNSGGATQGQAMRFKISGSHIGGSWQLVSLAFECMPGDLGNLKQFEE